MKTSCEHRIKHEIPVIRIADSASGFESVVWADDIVYHIGINCPGYLYIVDAESAVLDRCGRSWTSPKPGHQEVCSSHRFVLTQTLTGFRLDGVSVEKLSVSTPTREGSGLKSTRVTCLKSWTCMFLCVRLSSSPIPHMKPTYCRAASRQTHSR